MKQLIVNADDFGLSEGVNRGIGIAHENGIVTSASLMVLRPATRRASDYAKHHPALSVGLHLDLGDWRYVGGEWQQTFRSALPPPEEVEFQLEKFRELLGRNPTHIDSHQHVHRDAQIGALVKDHANALGIALRDHDARVTYCGDFYGQTATGDPLHDAISVKALTDLLRRLPEGITELGCHPGIGTDSDSPYCHERELELAALCERRVRSTIGDLGIQLCSFAEI